MNIDVGVKSDGGDVRSSPDVRAARRCRLSSRRSFAVRALCAALLATTVTVVGPGVGGATPRADAATRTFTGRKPTRLVDTRRGRPRRSLRDGDVIRFRVGTTSAVELNTTAVGATGPGYLAVYTCGQRARSSTVNLGTAAAVGNTTVVVPNRDKEVCLYASVGGGGKVDVIIDSYGSFSSAFRGQTPRRLIDTRRGARPRRIGPGRDLRVKVGVSRRVVALNVTAVDPTGGGYLTVYPCNQSRPSTTNINYLRGEPRAGFVLVNAGAGTVCVHTSASAHIVVDKLGSIRPGRDVRFGKSRRVVDSRSGLHGRRGKNFTVDLTRIRSQSGVMLEARGRAVSLNIALINPARNAYLTVYPCRSGRPRDVSAINATRRRPAVANTIIIQPDRDDRICISSNTNTDLVVDLGGFLNLAGDGPIVCSGIPNALRTVNQWRVNKGVRPMKYNKNAMRGARWWARTLLKKDLYRHSKPSDLARTRFEHWNGEVVSTGNTMTPWRNSAPHYKIITASWMASGAFEVCRFTDAAGRKHQRAVGWMYA